VYSNTPRTEHYLT